MKTVIVGATTNQARYAYLAAQMLKEEKLEIVPLGIKKGDLFGVPILDIREKPSIENVHTITLYIGPQHQPQYYEYLLSLNPKRIIFNPGTENYAFEKMIAAQGIEALEACTLVLLRTGQY